MLKFSEISEELSYPLKKKDTQNEKCYKMHIWKNRNATKTLEYDKLYKNSPNGRQTLQIRIAKGNEFSYMDWVRILIYG